MKAVILAGGRGTRLAPVTHGAVPKPMAELLGAPMLEHIVALLKRCGFRELCCTTACLPEQIERYFGDGSGFGVRMQYRREDRALGTAGAVKNCEDFIAGENALIISGDAACDFDLRALWNEHRRAHAAVTMALYPHEAPLPYGLAVTDGEGWVRSFIEKPAWERVVTDLVNTGQKNKALFEAVEKLMNDEHLYRSNSISIDMLVERLHSNRTYLSRMFTEQNTSFSEYINSYRIREALALLSEPENDIPLKVLSDSLGYNSLSSFYRAFQKEMGVPPSRFRQEIKKLHLDS